MSDNLAIDRMDLDGVASPAGLAARIHELIPDLPLPVPVKALCRDALTKRIPLKELVRADYPDLPGEIFDPARGTGEAAGQARAFAARAAAL